MQALFTFNNILEHLTNAFRLSNFVVFIFNNLTIAFYRINSRYYLFDSHSNDYDGLSLISIGGKSILMGFQTLCCHLFKIPVYFKSF